MNVIVNDLLVNYQIQGSGRPILFLHGWGDTLVTFNGLDTKLAKRFQIILLDLPGFGTTQSPSSAWGLIDYARFVQSFVNKLDVEPYVVVGHSNGGAIAIIAVANGLLHPERLVLLASAGVRSKNSVKKTAWKTIARTGKLAMAILPRKMTSNLRSRLYRSAGSDILVAPHMEDTFKLIVAHDVQDDASRLNMPVLIISGDNDTATPLAYAETFHRLIAGSKLTVVAGGDHFMHQNHAEKVAEGIEEFLE